jgi:hypothetical protein
MEGDGLLQRCWPAEQAAETLEADVLDVLAGFALSSMTAATSSCNKAIVGSSVAALLACWAAGRDHCSRLVTAM